MATYVNDLRLKEIATGDESGTWGTSTNTNLELIAEAFSFGTEAITTNADTHTTTIADGSTDPGRSMYLKYTGTLDSACTITIGPNTVSKMWFIENGTSGSQNIIISQGSGANITIPPGDVKVVYSDGAGSGAAVVDAFASLNVGALTATSLDISGDIDVDGTTNLDVVDIDGAANFAADVTFADGADIITASAGTSNFRAGVNAGNSIVSGGNYNTVVGDEAGTAITTGDGNSLVGKNAGRLITTGQYNTTVGFESLENTTTANDNTAMGYYSLQANTTGASNAAFGRQSLASNTTASNNTAVGYFSLAANTTGHSNAAFGTYTLQSNTASNRNTAFGYNSLSSLNHTSSTNGYNTVIGFQAGSDITTGTQNVSVGALALDANTTASNNTAVGYQALSDNTTGTDNTAVGKHALLDNITGDSNVAVGVNALDNLQDGDNNTAVGVHALGISGSGTSNTGIGHFAMGGGNVSGSDNTTVGSYAGSNVTTGSNNLLLGHDAGISGSPAGNINTESNEIGLGDENITQAHVQVDWTVASDARDKTDFTALDLGLDFVKALSPVTYKWDKRSKYGNKYADDYDLNAQTPDGTHKEDWLDIGFKAQEVEALEIAAGYNKDNKTNLISSHTSDGKQMGLQYSKFVPILVKAIQEQQTIIDDLKSRIETLEG